jgi:hypothetical protein
MARIIALRVVSPLSNSSVLLPAPISPDRRSRLLPLTLTALGVVYGEALITLATSRMTANDRALRTSSLGHHHRIV